MDKWVTILTVSLPQELWVIRTKLECEGIKCSIKDELTVQSYNFYSNAVGGVKLQVLEKDEKNALAILTELGYIKDEPVEPDLLTQIDKKTANIPFLKLLPVSSRTILLTLLICLPVGTI